jgi:hypothetical protein
MEAYREKVSKLSLAARNVITQVGRAIFFVTGLVAGVVAAANRVSFRLSFLRSSFLFFLRVSAGFATECFEGRHERGRTFILSGSNDGWLLITISQNETIKKDCMEQP